MSIHEISRRRKQLGRVRASMERNLVTDGPAYPPGRSVCWLVGLVELATVLTIGFGVLTASQAEPRESVMEMHETGATDVGSPNPESSLLSDDKNSGLTDVEISMLGTWEDDYKGHRTLTLDADGTGTMVVELDGLAATLFAKKLTFQEEWSVADGNVTMKAIGGEPVGKVKLVLRLHGDSSTQRIVAVTSERMILIEEASETRFEWRRVRAPESSEN